MNGHFVVRRARTPFFVKSHSTQVNICFQVPFLAFIFSDYYYLENDVVYTLQPQENIRLTICHMWYT